MLKKVSLLLSLTLLFASGDSSIWTLVSQDYLTNSCDGQPYQQVYTANFSTPSCFQVEDIGYNQYCDPKSGQFMIQACNNTNCNQGSCSPPKPISCFSFPEGGSRSFSCLEGPIPPLPNNGSYYANAVSTTEDCSPENWRTVWIQFPVCQETADGWLGWYTCNDTIPYFNFDCLGSDCSDCTTQERESTVCSGGEIFFCTTV